MTPTYPVGFCAFATGGLVASFEANRWVSLYRPLIFLDCFMSKSSERSRAAGMTGFLSGPYKLPERYAALSEHLQVADS